MALTGLIDMTVDEWNQPCVDPSRNYIRERARHHMKVPNVTIIERPGRRVPKSVWFCKIILERRSDVVRVAVTALSTVSLLL